jgi:hypothetical protein
VKEKFHLHILSKECENILNLRTFACQVKVFKGVAICITCHIAFTDDTKEDIEVRVALGLVNDFKVSLTNCDLSIDVFGANKKLFTKHLKNIPELGPIGTWHTMTKTFEKQEICVKEFFSYITCEIAFDQYCIL